MKMLNAERVINIPININNHSISYIMNYLNTLETHGWVTIPMYEKVHEKRDEFVETICNMPEYSNPKQMYDDNKPFVLNAFSALGNPSSFHNTVVRDIRYECHQIAKKHIFDPLLKRDRTLYLEQIIDRMLYRPKRVKVKGQLKHRSESKYANPDDIVFSGWVNLDDYDHEFRACPGSHMDHDVKNKCNGFESVKKGKHSIQHLKIPPGHMLLFYERMVTEMANSISNHKVHRLYVSFRLTKDREALHENGSDGILQDLINMNTITLRTGVPAWIWAGNHWTFPQGRVRIESISKDVNPSIHVNLTLKSTGRIYKNVVPRTLQSLKEYNMRQYRPYSIKEIAMHIPHRVW